MTIGSLLVGSILFLNKGVILFPHDERIQTFILFPDEEDAAFWRRELYLSRMPVGIKYKLLEPFYFFYKQINMPPWNIIVSTRIQTTGEDYIFKGGGIIKEGKIKE
jgi:hypothetical protein